MSLLAIDVGTTGAKAVVFDLSGVELGSSYTEYDISRPQPGYAELDPLVIWPRIRDTIAAAVTAAREHSSGDPVQALAVDSMGENLVPVSRDRQILGPSVMNMDVRGGEYLDEIGTAVGPDELYAITGNTLSPQFSIVKLMWLSRNSRRTYDNVEIFLPWNSFVSFMLGGDPACEYALASRTLLFDVGNERWSDKMISVSGINPDQLPEPMPAGTTIGQVGRQAAELTGLPPGIPIIMGAHDQPSASLGSGSISEGTAMYGMGTFHCIAPSFGGMKSAPGMIRLGLNTEHHAVAGLFLTLIYNSGGSVVKWFRDTFAADRESGGGGELYADLFSQMPSGPSRVRVLPHFTSMGPPDFIDTPNAVFTGMSLDTGRGEILKGIVEGNVFSLKITTDRLQDVGISITELRPTGGGSRSDQAVQICADILGIPCMRPAVSEASALGCAILAGTGSGVFSDTGEAVARLVKPGPVTEPDMKRHDQYAEPYAEYLRLREHMVGPLPS